LPHIKICNVHDITRMHHALVAFVKPLSTGLDNFLDLLAQHLLTSKSVIAPGHMVYSFAVDRSRDQLT